MLNRFVANSADHPLDWSRHSSGSNRGIDSMLRCGQFVITVKDSGKGMTQDDLNKIFEVDTQELNTRQSSGLGLFVSNSIVTMLGGELRAESGGLGQGTSFTVELPGEIEFDHKDDLDRYSAHSKEFMVIEEVSSGCEYTEVSSEDKDLMLVTQNGENHMVVEQQPSLLPAIHDARETLEQMCEDEDEGEINDTDIQNILVVDDVAMCRKMVCRVLIKEGYTTTQAINGRECLDLIENAFKDSRRPFFDLVIMDFEMPVLNGPDATREIVARKWDLPVIGLTGNVLPADRAYFLSCGALDILQKPLDMSILRDVIIRLNILKRMSKATSNLHPQDNSQSSNVTASELELFSTSSPRVANPERLQSCKDSNV